MVTSSVHKVLDILILFTVEHPHYTVEQISQHTEIPTSTAYRYIRILCDKGFLEKAPDGSYHLGLRMLELSRAARSSNRDLRLTLLPSMQRIASQIVETVTLMRLFNKHAMCVESIEGQQVVRVTIEQGRMQPLYAGASSKILLSAIDEAEWDNYLGGHLEALTQNTLTDVEKIKAQLRDVKKQGYATSNSEIDEGGRAIAVPIMNRKNDVVAALSIEGPFFRMTDELMSKYLKLLKDEATHVQLDLW